MTDPAGPRPIRWAVLAAASFGILGGIVGLGVGLSAYPPTAWFAVFELGLPAAVVGVWVGLICGVVVSLCHAIARKFNWFTEANPRRADVGRVVFIACAAGGIFVSLGWMDWAWLADGANHQPVGGGPVVLLVAATFASVVAAAFVVGHPRRWTHVLGAVVTVATVFVAITVATSRRHAADLAATRIGLNPGAGSIGPIATGYEIGAIVGVAAAWAMAVVAIAGLLSVLTESRRPRLSL